MGFFSVKNFEKFQHYKDRAPPWIRLYNALLDDYEYGRLQDASKAHLMGIWLLASRYDNKIPFDSEWISRRINATCEIDLQELADAGFIVPDQDCSDLLAPRKQSAMPEESRAEQSREVHSAHAPEPACRIEFEYQFWPRYPHRVGRPAAIAAFIAARQKASLADILDGLDRYIASKPPDRDWMNPETFLVDERWTDEPAEPAKRRDNPHNAILRSLAGIASEGLRDGGESPGQADDPNSTGASSDTDPYRELEIPPQLVRYQA